MHDTYSTQDKSQSDAKSSWAPSKKRARRTRKRSLHSFHKTKHLSGEGWRSQCAQALWQAGDQAQGIDRVRLHKQSLRLRRCGAVVTVLQCGNCESALSGTALPSQRFRCGSKLCTHCARADASLLKARVATALGQVKPVKGFTWKTMTLTLQRDVSDAQAHSPQALRNAVNLLRAGAKSIWNEELRTPGAGMLYGVEIAGTGHVHLHMLLYCRYVADYTDENGDHPWTRWAKARGLGFAKLKGVKGAFFDSTTGKLTNGALRCLSEICKYVSKGVCPLNERWLAGERRETIDPALGVAWVQATRSLRLRERFGIFRDAEQTEQESLADQAKRLEDRRREAALGMDCPKCQDRRWGLVQVPLVAWLRGCHAVGVVGLFANVVRSAESGKAQVQGLSAIPRPIERIPRKSGLGLNPAFARMGADPPMSGTSSPEHEPDP